MHYCLDKLVHSMHILAMLLDTHLKAKGLTDQEFAALIGCERSFVTRLRNGATLASFEVMQRIERATAGQVTPVDLYEARKAKLAAAPKSKKAKKRAAYTAAE